MFRFLSRIGQSPFRFDQELKKRSQRRRRLVFEGLERREMMAGDLDNPDALIPDDPTDTKTTVQTPTSGQSFNAAATSSPQAIQQISNTSDLNLALEAGLSHLANILDRDNGYLPFFAIWAFDNPAHMDFDNKLVSNVAGRALYALLAGHDAMGTEMSSLVYRELKDAVLKSLHKPRDGNWNNDTAANQMITGLASDPSRYGTDNFDITYLFNMGAGLRGLLGLATIPADANQNNAGYNWSSNEVFEVAVHNLRKYYVYGGGEIGGTKVFNWETFRSQLGLKGGDSFAVQSNWSGMWNNYVDPFFMWSLVHYYEETGHAGTLELIKELRDYVFYRRFPLNPNVDNYGKMFERSGEMNAWARVALVLDDADMMERCRARYEAMRGTIFSSTGWVPEYADKTSDVGEINDTCELIETALTFAEWGWTEYYEDAERFTRAMLLPSQLLDTSMVRNASNPSRDGLRNMSQRLYGAFGFPAPYGHIATRGAYNNGAFHADIGAGGVATLAELKDAMYDFEGGVHQLNLLFDVNNDTIIVASPYPYGDRLSITTKVAGDVRVRIPSWADRQAITQSLDEQGLEYQMLSDAVVVRQPQVGQSFYIALPLVEYQRTDVVNGRQIKILWHGDSVVAMSRMGTSRPFFPDIANVNLPPANQTPTVNAGPDRTIGVVEFAQLAGTVTDDGRSPTPLTVTWTKVSGAGYVTFADPNSPSTTATFSKPNTFVLRLTASDGEFTVSDTVTVTVLGNRAPTVSAGPDRSILIDQAAILAGTVSDDGLPNGSLNCTWTKVSGAGTVTFANPNAANTTATFSQAGTFVLRMTASDGEHTATDDVTVVVATGNKPPVIDAGPNRNILVSELAQLAGQVTDDGRSGKPLTITWSKRSGAGTVTFANPNSASTTATFSQANTFVLRMTVSDGEFTVTDDVTVVVSPLPANQPPTVNAGPNRTILVSSAAQLAGLVTDDGRSGRPLTITWSKRSGAGYVTFADPNSPTTTATFSKPNTFVLRLTVSDGQYTRTDDVTVVVLPTDLPSNQDPVVNAGSNQQITLGESATLRPTVSDDGLPLGGTLTYKWTLTQGPVAVTFANDTSANTTAQFSREGTYILRLTVRDGERLTFDELTVVVEPTVAPSGSASGRVNRGDGG